MPLSLISIKSTVCPRRHEAIIFEYFLQIFTLKLLWLGIFRLQTSNSVKKDNVL